MMQVSEVAHRSFVQLSGGCFHYSDSSANLDLCLSLVAFGSEVLFCATPTATGLLFIQSHPKYRHPRPTVGF
jgi:hypothetical protein